MSELATAVVIPDSIEPYHGWKALRIRADGRLESPQQSTIWPPKQRLEAVCGREADYSWKPIKGEPRRIGLNESPAGTSMMVTATVVSSTSMSISALPPKPQTLLPPGMNWSWEPTPHEPAAQNCHCGIYVVSDPRQASDYLKSDCVLAEIALWGNVVPGEKGARGQYAYPQQLYALEHLSDVAPLVAEYYGVPLGIRAFESLPVPKGKTLWLPSKSPPLPIPKNVPPPSKPLTGSNTISFSTAIPEVKPAPPKPKPELNATRIVKHSVVLAAVLAASVLAGGLLALPVVLLGLLAGMMLAHYLLR